MDLTEAEALARSLMKEHKLGRWRFRFDSSVRQFGCCDWRKKTISLSRKLTELNGEAEVRDVILHEIAHALAPENAGHNHQWKAWAREVGARPERCYNEQVLGPPEKYIGTCPVCGRRWKAWRKGKGFYCAACFGAKLPADSTPWIVWALSPEYVPPASKPRAPKPKGRKPRR